MTTALKWIAVLLGLTLIAGTFYRKAQRTSIPQLLKVADCTNDVLETDFRAPIGGHVYQLLLGGPHSAFVGEVEIRRASNTVNKFVISNTNVTACNWLDRKDIYNASILTWHLPNPLFQTNVTSGEQFRITIEFSQRPPSDCSIWLSWRQSYGNLKRDRQVRPNK